MRSIKEGRDIFGRNLKWEKINIKNLSLNKELIIKIKKKPFLIMIFTLMKKKYINLLNFYFRASTLTHNVIYRKLLFLVFTFIISIANNQMFKSIFVCLNKIINNFKIFR